MKSPIFAQPFERVAIWPVRLGVRTPGFHPGNRGSIPLRATEKLDYQAVNTKKGTELRTNVLFLYPFAFYTTSCKRKTFEFKS